MKCFLEKLGLGSITLIFVLSCTLFGCKKNEDLNGIGMFGTSIGIEYFQKGNKGYLLLEGEEEINDFLKDSMFLEIISFTDEKTGKSFIMDEKMEWSEDGIMTRSLVKDNYVYKNLFGFNQELFSEEIRGIERHYSIKYKVPSIYGERIEEIKLIYVLSDDFGFGFIEAWYNGKKISIFTKIELENRYPKCFVDKEIAHRMMNEVYYKGDTVVLSSQYSIHIILPIETP